VAGGEGVLSTRGVRDGDVHSVSNDRQHPKDSTMQVALSRWRSPGGDDSGNGGSPAGSRRGGARGVEGSPGADGSYAASVMSGVSTVRTSRVAGSAMAGMSSTSRTASGGGGGGGRVEDRFDPASLHHPEGHWHQVKREGDLSHALVTRSIKAGLDSSARGAGLFSIDSMSLADGGPTSALSEGNASLIDTERTMAGVHDHGRTSHSNKYFSSKGEPDDHLHGRSHRPMPWEPQAHPATVKTHVGLARSSPKKRQHHHHKLLSSRSLSGRSSSSASTASGSPSGQPQPVRTAVRDILLAIVCGLSARSQPPRWRCDPSPACPATTLLMARGEEERRV
jgi:hypothetical protein